MDDVIHCVTMTTSGCNDLQRAALWSELKMVSKHHRLPQECLNKLPGNLTEPYLSPVLQCVAGFAKDITDLLESRGTNGKATDFTLLVIPPTTL